jgi:Fuc2NAc and GlcNAc transferase
VIWVELVVLPIAAVTAAYMLTGRFHGYATSRLIDVPNDRSSHVVPTPRGGGIAIVAVVLVLLPVLTLLGILSSPIACAIFGAGAIVAVVGFADDHGHVKRRWRLLAHFGAGIWLVAWMGGPPPLVLPIAGMYAAWISYPLAVLFVAWLVNVFNFMDGIDGIASTEVATVSVAGAIVCYLVSEDVSCLVLPLVVAAAAIGFLLWNWPPARIFLGDVGSGFLGVVMAGLSLQAGWVRPQLFWSWVILLGVFVVDATVTLVRRAVRGDPFQEAHRVHAYQHAAVRFGAHRPVTLATGLINIIWLLPLALAVGSGYLEGVVGAVIAYIPLVVAALWLKAGKPPG